MAEIIIQYTLIVILVLGIGYLAYFLKEKGVIRNDDYFGITYTILGMLTAKDATPGNVKNILRAVSSAVQFVEENLKVEENSDKENKALELAKDSLKLLKLNSEISDDSIRFIIRITCALLPSTHKE